MTTPSTPSSSQLLVLVLLLLGGHGKDGTLECDDVRCPSYDAMVTMNDGRSFQTGCGYDPIETGCCFEYKSKSNASISMQNQNSFKFKCFKCQDKYLEVTEDHVICRDNMVGVFPFDSIDDIPSTFRDLNESPLYCGRQHNHNPGETKSDSDYFVSTVPNAGPHFSNQNWMSNLTSDHFLCNRYKWEQGDYKDDANLQYEVGIGADVGLFYGRHTRINFNNYIRNLTTQEWTIGPAIEGKVIWC